MNRFTFSKSLEDQYVAWRHELHSHPELAFNETRTADFIASKLSGFGIEVTTGIGLTGVVGTLSRGGSNKSIGLRADMDALSMDELNTFNHASRISGRMHACGHDGHIVMLLAAAQHLTEASWLKGTVHFIFQPAEEANVRGSGACAMIEDGLFERFPIDCIFALHNAPGLKVGAIATRAGAIMASMDLFDVTVTGHGTHGAFPHSGVDPVVIASAIISAWQTIVSRNINPQDSVVISATSVMAGDNYNVIPNTAVIKGSIRTLSPTAQATVKRLFITLTKSIAEGFGANVNIDYRHAYPVTLNDGEYTRFASKVASSIVGEQNVVSEAQPAMGSEDFAYMLQEKPGCYLWIGNSNADVISDQEACKRSEGVIVDDPCMLHDPTYDFNDSIIPLGAELFVTIAEQYLLNGDCLKDVV